MMLTTKRHKIPKKEIRPWRMLEPQKCSIWGLFSFIGVLCCVFVYATLCHHEWTIVLEFLSKLEVYKCEL